MGWPLCSSTFPRDGSPLLTALENGTAIGVCDGSYMPCLDRSRATAAWILVDPLQPDTASQCAGLTAVSGSPELVNAYRAELQGIHAILMGVHFLCDYHHVQRGHLAIFCDNMRAVALSKLAPSALRPGLSHLDLLTAICTLRQSLPISVSVLHVKGHQDDTSLWESLPLEAQLNAICDSRAKTYLLECIRLHHAPPPDHIYKEGPRVLIAHQKVITSIREAAIIRAASHGFKDYLVSKNAVTGASFHQINWDAIENAFSLMSDPFRLWAVKFVSGFSGTATRMHQWKLWPSPLCPCCGLVPETTAHLLDCVAPSIARARISGIHRIFQWLTTWETHPLLASSMRAFLQQDPCPIAPEPLDQSSSNVLLAFAQQLSLGYVNFWFGRHTTLWEMIQASHYQAIGHRRSGRAWASGFIRISLDVCHEIWMARNDVVHSRTLRGLDVMEARHLEASIRDQFTLGPFNLLSRDLHLVQAHPLDAILSLPADQKRIWLTSIRLARELGSESLQADRHHMSSILRQWLGR